MRACIRCHSCAAFPPANAPFTGTLRLWKAANTCSKYCPSNIQFSKIRLLRYCRRRRKSAFRISMTEKLTFGFFGLVVGLDRLELSTSPLSGVRSSHLSYRPSVNPPRPSRPVGAAQTGGAGRDRTGDLLNANQALSQLSYSPKNLNRGQLDAEQSAPGRLLL